LFCNNDLEPILLKLNKSKEELNMDTKREKEILERLPSSIGELLKLEEEAKKRNLKSQKSKQKEKNK
jgi:uncharacterized membrane protein